jgi:DnaJ-class molecular chaperone
MRKKTHYELLDVPRIVTRAEVRQAYHRLIREYHPVLNPAARPS